MLNYSKNAEFEQIPLSETNSALPTIPKVARDRISTKIPLPQQRYSDLNMFRQEIEQNKAGFHHKPFSYNKKNAIFYKTVFFAFAFLFAILAITTMAIPSALPCGFFSSCTLIKGAVISICTLLSLGSFSIAMSMRTEKEIVLKHVRHARMTLGKIYSGKQARLGISCFLSLFGPKRKDILTLRQMYHDTADKISEKKEEALHLTHRIATAQSIDQIEKENLLNQAIEEFHDKLLSLLNTFRHLPLR